MPVSWNDLLAALALVLVFEGLMPFLSPESFRRTLVQVAQLDDRTLRTAALLAMLAGLALLTVVR